VAIDQLDLPQAPPAPTDPLDVDEALLAIYEGGGGCFPRSRPVHAKGTLCTGRFYPSLAAAELTTAPHMQGDPVEVTVRFSNGLSDPHTCDYKVDVRGMATRFHLGGEDAPDEVTAAATDIVAVTLPCFFVSEPQQFPAFARANRSKPRLGLYVIGHPASWRAALALARAGKPRSYATCRYNAIHAYRWIDARRAERYVRYSWIPLADEQTISRRQARRGGESYLQHEISGRLRNGPVRFRLQLQIKGPDDSTSDPTTIWKSPVTVDAGMLELTGPELRPERSEKFLVFDPARLTDGIECSCDPILNFRPSVYEESARRRQLGECR
jgi:catalase